MPHRCASAAALLLAATASFAETRRYALELPAGQAASFEVEFEVRHPGTLTVAAEWSGSRLVALILDPPSGAGNPLRRSGVSPQRVDAVVSATTAAARGVWTLVIRSATGRDGGTGIVTLELPDAAQADPPRETRSDDTAPAEEAWRLPAGAPADWLRLEQAVRRFRITVAAEDRPDACRWQSELADFAEGRLRRLPEGGKPVDPATAGALLKIVEAIEAVEALRASENPLVIGPFPDEPARREAWLRLRARELRPVESLLDGLLMQLGRDHSRILAGEAWPVRLVSCLTACERHFDEAQVVGEERATNLELARTQWDRLLVAARLLETLAALQ